MKHTAYTFLVQKYIISSCVIVSLQGFVCEGVLGEDVVKLLEKAIQRHPDMDIEVIK